MSNVTFKDNVIIGTISFSLLAVFFSLVSGAPALTASPEPLRWTKVNIPAGGEAGNWVLASGSDIRHLALAGDGALYASVQGLTSTLYRSTDGGLRWTAIGNVHDTIIDIAVSPRDTKKIYYATTSAVYRSADGGRTFAALPANPGGAGTGQKEITSLDVTSLDNSDSVIAVGVRDTANAGYGGVYILDEANIIPAWVDTGIDSYDVYAVAFSPNYFSDRQLIAVTTDETDTFCVSRTADSGWNAVSGRARLNRDNAVPHAPVVPGGPATIAFPRNYDADPDSEVSVLFVAIATGASAGDVYKISFTPAPSASAATDLNAGQKYGLDDIDLTALTAAGDYPSAVLIAGEGGSSRTYASTDGGLNWTRSRKEPSGDAVACLLADRDFATSGRVYAATTGANSAFSLSRDIGITWNQLSLIDTTIDMIVDLAPSPRYAADSTLFMLTFGGRPSLWRSRDGGNSWERILAGNTGSVDALKFVGLPPRYGDEARTIFVAGESNGKPAVWQSTDDGQSYRLRFTRDPATGNTFPIDVWAIIDETSFFIGSYDGSHGLVFLTTSSGFIYTEGTPAGDQPLNSLAISPCYPQDGTILAGNTNGGVYLSTDNGTSFQPLPRGATSSPLSGAVAIAFDPRFDINHTVYAAGNSAADGIYHLAVPADQEWSSIDATLPAGAVISRLAIAGEGTLYAANFAADGGMERCLFPSSATGAVFETVTRYLPAGATLSGLWAGDHRIWSIDSTGASLLTFLDTLTAPAALTAPANQAAGIGSLSDHTFRNIIIDWETLEGATSYQWQCDSSADFTSVPTLLEGATTASAIRLPALEPATGYHWRVRASAPFLSPWSEKWSFTTGLDTEVITLKPESPGAGASGVPVKPSFQWTAITGASSYELLVAANAYFDHPTVIRTDKYALPSNAWRCDASLDYQTTYFWKVRAISSGTSSTWSSTGVFTTEAAPAMPAVPPVVPLLSPSTPPEKAPAPAVAAASLPGASTTPQIQPAPVFAPPLNVGALPSFSQSLDLPAWMIYFILGLLATVFLALIIILTIILKIRRF